jgi:hypothetical protein
LVRLRTHPIDAHDDLGELAQETKLIAHLPFLEHLRDLGRVRASRWLAGPGRQLGQTPTVDLGRLFAMPPWAAAVSGGSDGDGTGGGAGRAQTQRYSASFMLNKVIGPVSA